MRCASRIFSAATVAIVATLGFALVTSIAQTAWAQASRTIRVVVTVPAGGAIDALVRILADEIARTSGQTIVIDSRPGAGGAIAAEAVARAAPDGNSLLVNSTGLLINAILRKVSSDPLTSFEPVCKLVASPLVIVVNSASPYRTLADLSNGGTRAAR